MPRQRPLILINNFHQTSAQVRPAPNGYLSASQVSRARRALCGVRGCTCADDTLGTRGMGRAIQVQGGQHGDAWLITRDVEENNGGAI